MPKHLVMSKMSLFILIWFGQLVSLIGSGLTSFALGVWVYQRTGSVTQFSLIYLFALLPGILISPVAGALVDRWNRRWCMILSDSCGGLCTVAIAFLLAIGHLEIWHIYLIACLYSVFRAFQLPAYSAATKACCLPLFIMSHNTFIF
jgi:MFS transporter, DHA3 family, macrolide efflux protein